MDAQELQQVNDIVLSYFRSEAQSEEQVQQMMGQLSTVLKEEGAKLVHIGNTVFLVLVKGKGLVEVHTMGGGDSVALARNFIQLTKYLQNIGVKVAYTYSDDPKFQVVAKRTRLPFKTKEIQVPGSDAMTTAYYIEF